MSEKKISPFDECSCFVCLRRQNKQKKICVCLSGCLAVRTWTLHVDTITFEGGSGSKQNFVRVFYVWNVVLGLKSKVISWSWSWSWFWTNFLDIFSIWRITFSNEFHSEILILHMILILILKKKILNKVCTTKPNSMSTINIWNITIQKPITK